MKTENKAISILEYDKVLDMLAEFAASPKAKERIRDLCPLFDIKQVERLQELTQEAGLLRDKYLINPVYELDDMTTILEKANVGVTLQPSDFLKVARVLRAAHSAKKSVLACGDDVPLVKDNLSVLMPDMSLEKKIYETIAGENEIKDSASDVLRTLRRKIAALNNKLKDKLSSYTRSGETEKFLQDNIVTVREGRFVLPVKTEYKGNIPGLIHDRSASGATVFVEPFPIVEMNNEMKTLQLSERDEIERILKSLTAETAAASASLSLCFERLIDLDIIFAKAIFATAYSGVRPVLNDRGIVHLKNSRHPLIDKNSVVPVTVYFGKDFNILVITGPNTGGKTVSLKTVGLFCLMAYSGMKLPCDDGAEIAVFDNVFCDIGDEQSISQSLSTFSSHVTNIARITDSITPSSLVLLDEIGAGTDPIEGAALAVGIIQYLELMNCHGIVTTHYSELKEYALTSDKLMNACMQFDEKTLKPTFKLIMGLPGVSNALDIAKSLGINDYILTKAKSSLKEEKIQFEKILMNAEQAKSAALAELEDVRRIKEELLQRQRKLDEEYTAVNRKLEQINNNAKIETQKIVRNATAKADEILEAIREKMASADEAALLQAKKLHKELAEMQYDTDVRIAQNNYIPLEERDVKIGCEVVIKSLNAKGVIQSAPNKKGLITVSSGSVRLQLPRNDLGKVAHTPVKESSAKIKLPCKERPAEKAEECPVEEIRVLGFTVSEAVEFLEPHILSASAAEDKPLLKVVHGKGTGALGRGIQQYCRSHPLVKSFRYGGYGEGDTGVTFIELK